MRAEIDVRRAEQLLDKLKPASTEQPNSLASERYIGALAMIKVLGLSWSYDEGGHHRIAATNPCQDRTPALFHVGIKDVPRLRLEVRKALAQRDDTTSEVLKILASDPEQSIRELVAENQGTPTRTLRLLAQDADVDILGALARNPATPPKVLASLSEQCEAGESAFANSGWNLLALAKNPGTPGDRIDKLVRARRTIYKLLEDASVKDTYKTGILKHACESCERSLAGNPAVSSGLLTELSKSASPRVRAAAASNPSLTMEALVKLANDPSSTVVAAAMHSERITPDLLWATFEGEAREIREPSVLSVLGKRTSDYTRYLVAGNPSTPRETLEDLLDDECEEVRKEAAFTAGSVPWRWRNTLERHVVSPIDYLEQREHIGHGPLWNRLQQRDCHSSEEIIRGIASNSNLPDDLRRLMLTMSSVCALEGLAANPSSMPSGIVEATENLTKLASNESALVRVAVAASPATNADTLRALARDSDESVRRAVAWNVNTPTDALLVLCNDACSDVRLATVTNFKVEFGNLVESIASRMESGFIDSRHWNHERTVRNSSLDEEVLQVLADDPCEVVKATAAAKELAPASMLGRLSEDESDLVRQAVASNPNTPTDDLITLAQDKCPEVCEVVMLNPAIRLLDLTQPST